MALWYTIPLPAGAAACLVLTCPVLYCHTSRVSLAPPHFRDYRRWQFFPAELVLTQAELVLAQAELMLTRFGPQNMERICCHDV